MKYQDETIVSALIQTGSITGAADMLHISPLTVRRRMDTRGFADLYEEAQKEMVKMSAVSVISHMGEAFSVIHELMHDEETPPAVRLKAAEKFIDEAWRLSDRAKATDKEDLFPWQ